MVVQALSRYREASVDELLHKYTNFFTNRNLANTFDDVVLRRRGYSAQFLQFTARQRLRVQQFTRYIV